MTKYRREVFTKEIHVHLLVNYPPKVSVSNLVNSLKGVSSRMIRKKNYLSIRKKLGAGRCGRLATSPVAAGVRPSKSSASTSSRSRRHTDRPKDAYGVRAILPHPEG